MKPYLNQAQFINLTGVLKDVFVNVEVSRKNCENMELSNYDLGIGGFLFLWVYFLV